MIFRILTVLAATLVFGFFAFVEYINWREMSGGSIEFFRHVILVAGFLPWLSWVLLGVFGRPRFLGWPLLLAFSLIVWHYFLFAVSAHAADSTYWGIQVVEIVLAIVFITKLRNSLNQASML